MPIKPYLIVVSLVYTLVTIVQILRVVQGWTVTVDGTAIPLWASWIAIIVADFLAIFGFVFSARDPYCRKP